MTSQNKKQRVYNVWLHTKLPLDILARIMIETSTSYKLAQTCRTLAYWYDPAIVMNKFTRKHTYPDNNRVAWRLPDGSLHREGRPALLFPGHKIVAYYWRGLLHRVGGPAYILSGSLISAQFYYEHGELHREDGYAVEYNTGQKLRYEHGIKIATS